MAIHGFKNLRFGPITRPPITATVAIAQTITNNILVYREATYGTMTPCASAPAQVFGISQVPSVNWNDTIVPMTSAAVSTGISAGNAVTVLPLSSDDDVILVDYVNGSTAISDAYQNKAYAIVVGSIGFNGQSAASQLYVNLASGGSSGATYAAKLVYFETAYSVSTTGTVASVSGQAWFSISKNVLQNAAT